MYTVDDVEPQYKTSNDLPLR